MKCDECGGPGAQRTEATFADGKVEEVALCEECQEQYRKGDFVSDVVVLEDD